MSRNTAHNLAVFGASGSGKSSFIKQLIARPKPKRLIIWDPMREYGEFGLVTDSLSDLVQIARRKTFAVVFLPAADDKMRARQFDTFCALALAAGNCTVIVEELKFVTKPSWAPVRWAQVTMTGRHKGLQVIGASQRPASIDKDFMGNATVIHTGRLVYAEDIKAVAKAMQVQDQQIADLKPLEWLEKNMQTGQLSHGKITFRT